MEFTSTIKYIKKTKEVGLNVNDFNEIALKIIIKNYMGALFEVLLMDYSENESYKICKTIGEFYKTGFRKLLGF